jgi:hypothetical protein
MTVFHVAADIRGNHISKEVSVTVYGSDLSIVTTNAAFTPSAGYYQLTLGTADIGGYISSESLDFTVYENGVEVSGADIEWTIENDKVAAFDGNNIVSAGMGETRLVGTYTKDGATATATVHVNVIKPTLLLEYATKPVLEVENLSAFTVQSGILGTLEGVTLHGKQVASVISGNKIRFNKNNMPTVAKELGEQSLFISTDKVIYEVPVTLYTMIINDKEELDQLVSVAKKNVETEVGVWDGYFVLGNDIAYNGEFIPMTSHNHLYGVLQNAGMDKSLRYNPAVCGFRGVFDGMGYNIDGLAIGVNKSAGNTAEAGIFGVMHQNGIVRNVSFTNAVSRENSGYIAASGGGLIENVSITYKQIGGMGEVYFPGDPSSPRIMSSFYSTRTGVSDTACVRNCVVDASNAKIVWDTETKYQWPALQLAGKASVMENVIVICPNAIIAGDSGANYTFESYAALRANEYVQAEYALWDNQFWTSVNGIPFTVNMANTIDPNEEIGLNAPDVAFVGRDTEIGVIGNYVNLVVEECDGVTYANGKLTATEEALGKTVTLVVTSYLNDQVVEKEITIKKLVEVTLNQKESVFVESVDTTLDISVGNAYNGEKATIYVGSTVVGEGKITNGKVPVDASLFTDAGYGETTVQVISEKNSTYSIYDLKVFYVTKVLRSMSDFKAISVQGGDRATDPVITGYYILGNDIDCKGEKISASRPTSWNSDLVGFRGTFDGNGKTISNAKIGACGLFGHVGKDAVIQNVAFDEITFTAARYQRTTLFGNFVQNATLRNITVNIVKYEVSTDGTDPYVEQGLFAGRYFIGNVVENVTFHVDGFDVYRIMARVCKGNSFTGVKIYANSYQTIGDSDDDWTAITELPEGMEFIKA